MYMCGDVGYWLASRGGRFTSGKRAPVTYRVGGSVTSRTGMDLVEKFPASPAK
jgi:hypothetical protein